MITYLALITLINAPLLLVLTDLRPWGRREPWASEIAYREGRQCRTALYSWGGGYPDRCAYPEDHYGSCES